MKTWNYIKKTVVYLGDGSTLIAGVGVCLMGLMLAANTISRYGFNSPWPFGEEYTAYILVLLTFFPLAYTMRKKGHVRIEIVINHLPVKARRWLIIAYTFISIIVVGVMIYYGLELSLKSLKYGIKAVTVMQTPLWIAQMFVVIGLIIFFLQLILYLVSRLGRLREEYPRESLEGV